jgi:uncharacterized protein with HEPN domain
MTSWRPAARSAGTLRGIEWPRIAGLRDILIHEYFDIDVDLIWNIAEAKVPELLRRIEEHLSGHS